MFGVHCQNVFIIMYKAKKYLIFLYKIKEYKDYCLLKNSVSTMLNQMLFEEHVLLGTVTRRLDCDMFQCSDVWQQF